MAERRRSAHAGDDQNNGGTLSAKKPRDTQSSYLYRSVVWTRLDAVFPILQRLVHADFAAVEIGFYAQCWSCFSELDVGWLEPFLFIFNRKTNYGNHKLELTSHCLTSDWQLKDCDTFCSMAYIFKGHLTSGSGCLSLKTS